MWVERDNQGTAHSCAVHVLVVFSGGVYLLHVPLSSTIMVHPRVQQVNASTAAYTNTISSVRACSRWSAVLLEESNTGKTGDMKQFRTVEDLHDLKEIDRLEDSRGRFGGAGQEVPGCRSSGSMEVPASCSSSSRHKKTNRTTMVICGSSGGCKICMN